MRIVALAQDAVTFHRLEGVEAAIKMAQERKGTMYDPRMVECFCKQASLLLAGLEDEPSWEVVLSLEPGTRTILSDQQFDNACQAIADFADLKSPYTLGHSAGVAQLAASAARRYGLPEVDIDCIKAGRIAPRYRTGRHLRGYLGKAGLTHGEGVGACAHASLLYRAGVGQTGFIGAIGSAGRPPS